LSGASRRHVALHPAAIFARILSTPSQINLCEQCRPPNATPGLGSPARLAGSADSASSMRSQIALSSPRPTTIGVVSPPRQRIESFIAIRFIIVCDIARHRLQNYAFHLHANPMPLMDNPPTPFGLGCEPVGELGHSQTGCNRCASAQRLNMSVNDPPPILNGKAVRKRSNLNSNYLTQKTAYWLSFLSGTK